MNACLRDMEPKDYMSPRKREELRGVWSSGRWCLSKVFRDRGTLASRERRAKRSPGQQRVGEMLRHRWRQAQVLWGGRGVVWWEVALEGQSALEAGSGVVGKAGAPDV